jgi:hypothetical protein
MRVTVILNLALLVLFPLSWAAPLVRAGLLPLFGLSEISVLSGIASLRQTDIALALLVALFALVAPMAKTLALALNHAGRAPATWLPALGWLGRLAMADVFLIALSISPWQRASAWGGSKPPGGSISSPVASLPRSSFRPGPSGRWRKAGRVRELFDDLRVDKRRTADHAGL